MLQRRIGHIKTLLSTRNNDKKNNENNNHFSNSNDSISS